MHRRTDPAPDTGRIGFRYEWEAVDERPLIVYPYPFWADETERMTYEAAVEANPRRGGEIAEDYAARIVEVVTGKYGGKLPSMPHVRQSRRERDAALERLRRQAHG